MKTLYPNDSDFGEVYQDCVSKGTHGLFYLHDGYLFRDDKWCDPVPLTSTASLRHIHDPSHSSSLSILGHFPLRKATILGSLLFRARLSLVLFLHIIISTFLGKGGPFYTCHGRPPFPLFFFHVSFLVLIPSCKLLGSLLPNGFIYKSHKEGSSWIGYFECFTCWEFLLVETYGLHWRSKVELAPFAFFSH